MPALNTINAPTLVCVGDRDRANMPSAHLLAERIPGATLRVIPDSGHLWNLQRPELCTEIISDFVSQATRGTSRRTQ